MKKICMFAILLAAMLCFFGCQLIGDNGFFTKNTDETNKDQYEIYYDISTFKGLELYCWKNNGKWECALMGGTNRHKEAEEIETLQEKYPCPILEMKEILMSYTDEERSNMSIRIVSMPPKQEEIESQGINEQNKQDYLEIYMMLGLLNTEPSPDTDEYFSITYEDPDGAIYSHGMLVKNAKEGDTVSFLVSKICDADVLIYVNGEKLQTTPVEHYNYYEHKFIMPAKDTVVKLDISTGPDISTEPDTVYLFQIEYWLADLHLDIESIEKIEVEQGFIGVEPGSKTHVSVTEDEKEIERLVWAWHDVTVEEIYDDSWQKEGGWYAKTYFVMSSGEVYIICINNGFYSNEKSHFRLLSEMPMIIEDFITSTEQGSVGSK